MDKQCGLSSAEWFFSWSSPGSTQIGLGGFDGLEYMLLFGDSLKAWIHLHWGYMFYLPHSVHTPRHFHPFYSALGGIWLMDSVLPAVSWRTLINDNQRSKSNGSEAKTFIILSL